MTFGRVAPDLVLGLGAVAVLAVAATMTPSDGTLQLLGVEVPGLCLFKRATGIGCPGCGMTRAFVWLAHGELGRAFALNPLSPILFGFVAAQVPWRAIRLARKLVSRTTPRSSPATE